jgi:hypothetical protein
MSSTQVWECRLLRSQTKSCYIWRLLRDTWRTRELVTFGDCYVTHGGHVNWLHLETAT